MDNPGKTIEAAFNGLHRRHVNRSPVIVPIALAAVPVVMAPWAHKIIELLRGVGAQISSF